MSTKPHPKLDLFLAITTSVMLVIASFVIPPPSHVLGRHYLDWQHGAVFIAALLIGLLWHRLGTMRHLWPYLLGASFVLFLTYRFLLLLWTCELEQGRVVIGSKLSLAAENALQRTGNKSCRNLLESFASDPSVVYDPTWLYGHEVLLGGIYIALASIFCVCVVLLEHTFANNSAEGKK
jgi:hypothetical protein